MHSPYSLDLVENQLDSLFQSTEQKVKTCTSAHDSTLRIAAMRLQMQERLDHEKLNLLNILSEIIQNNNAVFRVNALDEVMSTLPISST